MQPKKLAVAIHRSIGMRAPQLLCVIDACRIITVWVQYGRIADA